MARILPYSAVQFAAHEQYKWLLQVDHLTKSQQPGKPVLREEPVELRVRRFACGSLAGLTSVTATYPLDMARARMAVTKRNQ